MLHYVFNLVLYNNDDDIHCDSAFLACKMSFVVLYHENNFQLHDEDVVLERNSINIVHQLHYVSVAKIHYIV